MYAKAEAALAACVSESRTRIASLLPEPRTDEIFSFFREMAFRER